jgi:hypothetical protein
MPCVVKERANTKLTRENLSERTFKLLPLARYESHRTKGREARKQATGQGNE